MRCLLYSPRISLVSSSSPSAFNDWQNSKETPAPPTHSRLQCQRSTLSQLSELKSAGTQKRKKIRKKNRLLLLTHSSQTSAVSPRLITYLCCVTLLQPTVTSFPARALSKIQIGYEIRHGRTMSEHVFLKGCCGRYLVGMPRMKSEVVGWAAASIVVKEGKDVWLTDRPKSTPQRWNS